MQHHSLFSDKSDLYASARPSYPSNVFKFLTKQCAETGAAWDCACGNGQAASDLLRTFDVVYASDISQEQIANAVQHPKIHYSVMPSEQTHFKDRSLDLICVAQALHWFDHKLYWQEVKRVLKPGGVFSTLAYKLPTIAPAIDRLIQTQILSVIEPFWSTRNQLINNDYKDLHFPFRKLDPPHFNMIEHWNLHELFNFIHTFSATRRCMDQLGNNFFESAYRNAHKIWGNAEKKKTVNFDLFIYVGLNQ